MQQAVFHCIHNMFNLKDVSIAATRQCFTTICNALQNIVITFHNKLFYDFHLNVQRRMVP